jgi:DNA-binding beta-propeller fold protein YncE
MWGLRKLFFVGLSTAVVCGAAATAALPATAAAPAGDASAPIQYPYAYAVNSAANTVTRVGLGFGVVGKPITVGTDPVALAITPDDKLVLVVNHASNSVTPFYTATGVAGPPIPVGTNPVAIAITPDGKMAYVTNSSDGTITPIVLATRKTLSPIEITAPLPGTAGIVISPDGKTGYVDFAPFGEIVTFDTATGTPDRAGAVNSVESGVPTWLAMAPNGKEIFGASASPFAPETSATLQDIELPGFFPGNGDERAIGAEPTSVAITPDGMHVFTDGSATGSVSEYTINHPITTITLGGSPHGVAVAPDGRTLWVADAASGKLVRVIVATGAHTLSFPVSTSLDAVAIAPDQAPIAALTVTPALHSRPSLFDASASTVRFGTIAKYVWSFGDATTATTTTPTTAHTYAGAGSYTATVTETDSAGTSTTLVFTGQTVSRNGGPSAVASRTFTVGWANRSTARGDRNDWPRRRMRTERTDEGQFREVEDAAVGSDHEVAVAIANRGGDRSGQVRVTH